LHAVDPSTAPTTRKAVTTTAFDHPIASQPHCSDTPTLHAVDPSTAPTTRKAVTTTAFDHPIASQEPIATQEENATKREEEVKDGVIVVCS
jgi:hypothetical protein